VADAPRVGYELPATGQRQPLDRAVGLPRQARPCFVVPTALQLSMLMGCAWRMIELLGMTEKSSAS
jgi:hypothetical protein